MNEEMKAPEFYVERIGPAPLDYLIVVHTMINQVPRVKPLYSLIWCDPMNLEYIVTEYPVLKDGKLVPPEDRGEPLEYYNELEDAGKSDYFRTILFLDRELDKKLAELKQEETDTKYAPHGIRIGASYNQGTNLYGEAYNSLQPEHDEYVQVFIKDGKTQYTASHKSYFKLYELGEDIYSAYFGKAPKESYFVKTDDLKKLSAEQFYFALPFKTLQHTMIDQQLETGITDQKGSGCSFDPIITVVHGVPTGDEGRNLCEAQIDFAPNKREYVIFKSDKDEKQFMISQRSMYSDAFQDKIKAFDFDWDDLIVKRFQTYDEAENDPIYGDVYKALFKLDEAISRSGQPYVWRYGDDDKYGFMR